MTIITATKVFVDREGYERTKPVLINLDNVRFVGTIANGDEYRPTIHWVGGQPTMTLDENFADFAERINIYQEGNTP